MSRVGTQDTVIVKPANNIYTALAFVALIVVLASLAILYFKANTLFGKGGLLG
jgi:hypothetical protein